MANVTRTIGLSLGADICWPICFEQIMKRLALRIPHNGDTLDFHVERVTIEPFAMTQAVKYDVVVDRLTHWYDTTREWIKKGVPLRLEVGPRDIQNDAVFLARRDRGARASPSSCRERVPAPLWGASSGCR